MKNLILGLFILATFSNAEIIKKSNYNSLDKIPINRLLYILTNKISQNLPMRIDYLTTTLSTIPYKNRIITRKEINSDHKNFKEIWPSSKDDFINEVFKMEIQSLCYDPFDNYLLIQRDVEFLYKYLDKNKKILFEYVISKKDCETLKD